MDRWSRVTMRRAAYLLGTAAALTGFALAPVSTAATTTSTPAGTSAGVTPPPDRTPPPQPSPVAGGTFVVNSTGDQPDAKLDGTCLTAAGTCTLRAALREADNVNGHAEIDFDIPGGGVQTITLTSNLPRFLNPNGITVDGFTQPGASPNTDPQVDNATLTISIVGNGYTRQSYFGLWLQDGNNVIKGLDLYNLQEEIYMAGSESTNNQIIGDIVCTDPTGTFKATTTVAGADGVVVQTGASDNWVGEPGNANRNTESGCPHHGIDTARDHTDDNTFQNNIVGLNPLATKALPNRSHGIDMNTGTAETLIGGLEPGEGNVLSGNTQEGIEISHGTNTVDNYVIGNYIGTDASGDNAYPWTANNQWGVHLEGAPSCDDCGAVGGDDLVMDNVIVNSNAGGVLIDKGQNHDVVQDNEIGVTANGTPAGNRYFGVRVEHDSFANTIGPNNEIAYNDNGIQLQSTGTEPKDSESDPTSDNTITQNSIHDNKKFGIDLAPLSEINPPGGTDPNTNNGIDAPVITSAQGSTVSGTTCANCTVEVFVGDSKTGNGGYPQGQTFVGSGTADGSGSFAVNTSASAGQVVVATTTDPQGDTSEYSNTATVTAQVYASDSFSRTVSKGWGTADVGGKWTLQGVPANYSVNGSTGNIAMPKAGTGQGAYLDSATATNAVVSATESLDKVPAGGNGAYLYVVTRRIDNTHCYRLRARVAQTGAVYISLSKLSGSDNETLLTGETRVAGLSYTPGQVLHLKLLATGTNPTALSGKVWPDGTTEPAWQVSTTDSDAALQGPGSAGVWSYLSGQLTDAPLNVQVDDMDVRSP